LKKILHPHASEAKGLSDNPANFCKMLSKFFTDKILKLHDSNKTFLTQSGHATDAFLYDLHSTDTHTVFTPVTPQEVSKLISGTKFKFSPVDDFPSSLIKSCPISFATIISKLADLSFTQGKFPSRYKHAQITPILKKPSLKPDEPNNFRPISNLNSVSKLLERLALARLSPTIVSSTNFNPLQSAYRKKHSTETCTLKTLSDVYRTIDSGSSAMVVSLDLSAAFDTVSHETLLARLHKMFGLSGNTLNWISSYLSNRTQSVSVDDHCSPPSQLSSGVPQGSVLGPLLFTAYTSPVFSLISSFGLGQQHYADDTQVFTALSKTDPHLALHTLQNCLSALRLWYAQNSLTINPSKSEAMCISTHQRLKTISSLGINSVSVAGSPVSLCKKQVTLGLNLDNTLTFTNHIQFVVRSSMFHVRALRHIRPLLNQHDASIIASSLIHSKLDYLNSVLHNTSTANIQALQRTQNAAARVCLRSSRNASTSKLLSTLHWLPVKYRIVFKIATLTHSALYLKQPAYLHDIHHLYTPSRELRSSDQHLLVLPRTHLHLTDQSFEIAAPSIWNALPLEMRTIASPESFRSKLKTHLFASVFGT
jgi:hypothetical protein